MSKATSDRVKAKEEKEAKENSWGRRRQISPILKFRSPESGFFTANRPSNKTLAILQFQKKILCDGILNMVQL